MARKPPLTEQQIEVLRWIGEGCPEGRWTDYRYKTTCYALASRGLADVDRRPASWSAAITEAGKYYLEHRRYPGASLKELQERADAAGGRRFMVVSAAEYAAAIMQELESRGEPFELERAGRDFSAEDVAKAAVRSPWRPKGKRLTISATGGWADRRYIARLVHDPAADVERIEVKVPAKVARFHPAVSAYRDDADRHEVSKAILPRACRIIHALATEAERREYSFSCDSRPIRGYSEFRSSLSGGQFSISVRGHGFGLRLTEASAGGGGPKDYRSDRRLPRWHQTRNTTFVPSGKLSLSITNYSRSGRKDKFVDTKRNALEEQLGDLLWELEVQAMERDQAAQDRAREVARRRDQWKAAVAEAQVKMIEADRIAQLHNRAEQWHAFTRLCEYARAVRNRIDNEEIPSPEALRWISWMDEHLAACDPLREPAVMPAPPEPNDENMKPHLRGWTLREPT